MCSNTVLKDEFFPTSKPQLFKKVMVSRIISCTQNSRGHSADVPHDKHPKLRICMVWGMQELGADPQPSASAMIPPPATETGEDTGQEAEIRAG